MRFNSILKKCLNCNKEFWVWPSHIKRGRGKYCSKECWYAGKSIIKKCPTCKKEFKVWISRIRKKRGLYCSRKCMNESPIFAEKIRKANRKFPHRFQKGHKTWNMGKKLPEMSGKNHPMWKGGIWHDSDGYIWLLRKEHPRCNKYGYILRSHLVAEKYLNRLIQLGEIIHHINGIRNDDRPENLYLFPSAREHRKFHSSKVKSELQSNLTS